MSTISNNQNKKYFSNTLFLNKNKEPIEKLDEYFINKDIIKLNRILRPELAASIKETEKPDNKKQELLISPTPPKDYQVFPNDRINHLSSKETPDLYGPPNYTVEAEANRKINPIFNEISGKVSSAVEYIETVMTVNRMAKFAFKAGKYVSGFEYGISALNVMTAKNPIKAGVIELGGYALGFLGGTAGALGGGLIGAGIGGLLGGPIGAAAGAIAGAAVGGYVGEQIFQEIGKATASDLIDHWLGKKERKTKVNKKTMLAANKKSLKEMEDGTSWGEQLIAWLKKDKSTSELPFSKAHDFPMMNEKGKPIDGIWDKSLKPLLQGGANLYQSISENNKQFPVSTSHDVPIRDKNGKIINNHGTIYNTIKKLAKDARKSKNPMLWGTNVKQRKKSGVMSTSSVFSDMTIKPRFTIPKQIKDITENEKNPISKKEKKPTGLLGTITDLAYKALFEYKNSGVAKTVSLQKRKRNKNTKSDARSTTHRKSNRSYTPRYTYKKPNSGISYNKKKNNNPFNNIPKRMRKNAAKMLRYVPLIPFNPFGLFLPRKHANGGIINEKMLTWAGEEGSEAIIPLTASRRDRGLELWKRTGKMLGAYPNAKSNVKSAGLGAISGQSHSIKKDRSGKQSNSQINIGGVTIQLTASNTDGNLVNMINAQKEEIANTISGIIAEALESGFENLPVSVA